MLWTLSFTLVRTGSQWRYLPKDFPPRSTVWGYYDEWRHNGTLENIHDKLLASVFVNKKNRDTCGTDGCGAALIVNR